jgi:diketogulonate reductase-like aldo/keto reductase
MKLTVTTPLKLNNGVEMPIFGLGTFLSERGDTTRKAVLYALEAGYRHIDTAAIYGNETDVGAGVRESGIPKSVRRERIIENAQVFDFAITPEDMKLVDGLNENFSVVPPDWAPDKWV